MTQRMYTDLSRYWHLLSPPEEYEEEAALYRDAILEFAPTRPRTLLELGSGGGNNAVHLKQTFEMTLVDVSEGMLEQSRKLHPEVPHHLGDMRDVRLGAEFDAVFIHDAISYMTTREDLERAMATAFAHCKGNGVAVFAPDETKERFAPDTTCGGSDDGERGFRYMEWVWDPNPDDETVIADYAFLIREPGGEVRVVHDRHVHGLFPRQVWLDTMAAVGFEVHSKVYEHSELPLGYELFVGVRP